MNPVAYHRLAASELVKSAEFYERRRPQLGDRFLDAVEAVQEQIRRWPELGRREPAGTQSLKVKRFPFRVFYLVQPDRLWIVAVAHLSRRPGHWRRRLD
jgi:hypothetical protein